MKKAEKEDINSVHLRDKDTLYADDDETSVVTMYLTVSRGNASENTDHSWSEINSYSVEDYENMGVDRYQVAGLLQVGDENGPTSGNVGYAEEVPNATVQIRGQTSSSNAQKNYKIELKKNKGTWRGQRVINLNKHQGEGMRFRNKMAYDLIKGIPQMMGLRTQFVHLYVKDNTDGSSDAFQNLERHPIYDIFLVKILFQHLINRDRIIIYCIQHMNQLCVVGITFNLQPLFKCFLVISRIVCRFDHIFFPVKLKEIDFIKLTF